MNGSAVCVIGASHAGTTGVERGIAKTAEISAEKTVVRLGPIRIAKTAQIALAEPIGAGGAAASP